MPNIHRIGLVLLSSFLVTLPNIADQPIITEWEVPYENSRPRDPFVDSSGIVWFVGQTDDYVASFDPGTGQFRRIALPSGTGPHNLIVAVEEGGSKTIYYAGNRTRHIGRMSAESGNIHKILMPDAAARDPHTLVFDAAGDIWFTLQNSNLIAKLTLADEVVRLVRIPDSGTRPYGINIAPNGIVWASLFGTNKLVRIDPQSYKLIEVELPRAETRPRRLEITSDGLIWYVDYAAGYLGRLDPESGLITEWRTPSKGNSFPYAMEVDRADRIWFVETGPKPNLFVGFDTKTEEYIASVPLESGGGTVRHMHYEKSSNSIWFGTDANTIGQAQLPK